MSIGRASWHHVVEAFRRHFEHYLPQGGEAAVIGLRAEGSVTLQYAGRVVLELFQNALDRAEAAGPSAAVMVRMDGETLVVGNNGRPFQVDSTFDYSSPREGEERADFNALCALHTSNKAAERQFGNKGIGFRSVFGVSQRVQVWSRLQDGGWWGLELRTRLRPADWPGSAIGDLDAMVNQNQTRARPSFHLPIPLRSAGDPVSGADGMETIIVLPIADAKHRQQIGSEVDALRRDHLRFVGLRKPGLTVALSNTLVVTDAEGVHAVSAPDLCGLAALAEHAVSTPTVAITWSATAGRFYNYLPTRMVTGVPVDVHGDFQVKADREGMALDEANPVGRYNRALLRRAARLFADRLDATATEEGHWRRANCPNGGPAEWGEEIAGALFRNGSWAAWVRMAAQHFAVPRSPSSYEEFWLATGQWLDRLAGCGAHTKTWQNQASELCARLASSGAKLIPVHTRGGDTAVSLPSRQDEGVRAERRVFYVHGDIDPEIPSALLAAGRALTRFPLGSWERPAGVVRYEVNEVLRDFRQVPIDATGFQPGEGLAAESQRELLMFASDMLDELAPANGFAWRSFPDSGLAQRMGRAIATLFLPTTDGAWEPARQLAMDRVDQSLWPGLLSERLCAWLGVAPAGGVALVERGVVVAPQARPPALQAAGSTHVGELRPRVDACLNLASVATTVAALPPGLRDQICRGLGEVSWYPTVLLRVHDRLPPHNIPVAPRDLVLARRDARTQFLPVPALAEDDGLLLALGAHERVHGSRSDDLLRALTQRIPHPEELDQRLQMRMGELVDALVGDLPVAGGAPVPVLVHDEGAVRWLQPGETAWMAPENDQNIVRRFFRTVRLVVGDWRDGLPERLGVGTLRLAQDVHSSSEPDETTVASDIHARIDRVLGPLCALAELSGQWREADDGDEDRETRVRRRWSRAGVFLQAPDVWLTLTVTGPQVPQYHWRKGEFEDVFEVPSHEAIYFDSRLPAGPPLPTFGTAVAQLVTQNRALGPTFVEVLAAHEADEKGGSDWITGKGRLHDILTRRHAADAAREWQNKVRPLNAEQIAALTAAVGTCVREPAVAVRRGILRRSDLLDGQLFGTVQQLQKRLDAACGDPEIVPFLPRVAIRRENAEAWRAWMGRWGRKLQAWFAQERGPFDAENVEEGAAKCFDDVAFVAGEVASAALDVTGDLEAILAGFAPRFAPVVNAPDSGRWASGAGRLGPGGAGPERKLEIEDILNEQIAKETYGEDAEVALLDWVVDTTAALFGRPGAREVLLSALAPESETRKAVAAALDADDLRRALKVSDIWSGAGFDLLGLEDTLGALGVVRYECKGLPAGEKRVRVHVSRNQLALARRIGAQGPGRWMLVGVEPDGRASDITQRLGPLLDPSGAELRGLLDAGIEPDGLWLVIRRD